MSEDSLPKWRAPLDPSDLMRYATRAVKTAERIMYDAYQDGERELALKACTRLTQAAQTYVRVVEAAELEERVAKLERAVEARQSRIYKS